MTSILKFTPITGALAEQPLCYLLEIDELRILLDCGWNDSFDLNMLKPLAKIAPKVNYVLISHPDMEHIGALPYAVSKLGLTAKIIGTIPVQKMGCMTMYDAYQSRKNYEDFDLFNLDDVDEVFDNFITLKYNQRFTISENGIQLEITPHAAGHTLGGTIWRIKSETDDIVYAVDYNHKKERHLNPTVLETLNRPTLLITDSLNALNTQLPRRQRDSRLYESIIAAMEKGGNVLIPVDSAARVLELLVVLDQHWQYYRHPYHLIMLSNVSRNTVEFAKSNLEWMSDVISKNFFTTRENAFALDKVNMCHSIEEIYSFQGPKLVLSTMSSLLTGFALELFIQWSNDSRNSVIFVDRSFPNTPARRLMENPKIGTMYLEHWKRVPLVGIELEEFEFLRNQEKELELAKIRAEEEKERNLRQQTEMYDYEGEDKDSISSLSSLWQGHDLYTKSAPSNSSLNPMFPCIERRSVFDEYGEVIRPEDLAAAAEKALAFANTIPTTYRRGRYIKQQPKPIKKEEEMEVEEKVQIPTKCIRETLKVSVQCNIEYIDFEGRSDGRSIKKILSHVQPRKLVLIHGGVEATANLEFFCKNMSDAPKSILTPRVGETVDVTEATNLFRMHLKSNFMESLSFIDIPESKCSISYIDGIIMIPPKELGDDDKWFQPEPYLDVLPNTAVSRGHDSLFVGDVKLSNFRQVLQEYGLRADFKEGVLVVNGSIALWRDTESNENGNNIHIDGALSEDYFRVRELLYSQFHLL
jgi:cleavage and polyadenylation specificity factor subunit 2